MSVNTMTHEINKYINASPEFAQPIIKHIITLIETAIPSVEAAIKWQHPCFSSSGLVVAIAAFKKHVNFSFFQGVHLNDHAHLFTPSENNALAALKFTSLQDLPDDEILLDYIAQAAQYNKTTEKKPNKIEKKDKATLVIPDILQQALNNNTKAQLHFSQFSYSKQKDYIEWITSAKREATKLKRLATALQWIEEGKSKNWKYENC